MEITIIGHQDQHFGQSRPDKSKWIGGRKEFDPLLIKLVSDNETLLIDTLKDDTRDPKIYYLTDTLGSKSELYKIISDKKAYQGICVEIVVGSTDPLKIDVHGYPAVASENGLFKSKKDANCR